MQLETVDHINGAPRRRTPGETGSLRASAGDHPSHHDQLAQMMGIVIAREEDLAKQRLTIAVRNRREEVVAAIARHGSERAQRCSIRGDALIPRSIRRRRGSGWPVARRPGWGDVLRMPAEFDDVPQSDPEMLEELPRRMRRAGRADPAAFRRKVLHRIIEAHVSAVPVEKARQLIAKS